MGESDWGTRLQNKDNSNNSNSSSSSNDDTKASNNKGPKFGTQVLNEGFDPTNIGITRYEVAEKDNEKK